VIEMVAASLDWWDVSQDPDPVGDLGYEVIDLDVIRTANDGRQRVLVLPTDEDLLREDAFMVVDEDDVRDLETMV
jgi:hypothetical protein